MHRDPCAPWWRTHRWADTERPSSMSLRYVPQCCERCGRERTYDRIFETGATDAQV